MKKVLLLLVSLVLLTGCSLFVLDKKPTNDDNKVVEVTDELTPIRTILRDNSNATEEQITTVSTAAIHEFKDMTDLGYVTYYHMSDQNLTYFEVDGQPYLVKGEVIFNSK